MAHDASLGAIIYPLMYRGSWLMPRCLELPVSLHCIGPSDRSDPEVSGLLWTLINGRLPISTAKILSQGVFPYIITCIIIWLIRVSFPLRREAIEELVPLAAERWRREGFSVGRR
jgi:hypothetical protein